MLDSNSISSLQVGIDKDESRYNFDSHLTLVKIEGNYSKCIFGSRHESNCKARYGQR